MIATLVTMLYFQSHGYHGSISEYEIRTKISLRPVDEVPFPSVTVDISEIPDPMGYVKRSGGMIDLSDLEGKVAFHVLPNCGS